MSDGVTTETTATETAAETTETTTTETTEQAATTETTETTETDLTAALYGAPEAYELALPENTVAPEGFFDAFNPIAKKYNLSQEGAQALLNDLATEIQPKMIALRDSEIAAIKAGWVEQTKSDKEIGGIKFDENVTAAKRALATFSTPEFVQLLDETGVGNHPETIRLFLRLSKSMREDSVIAPDNNPGTTTREDRLKALYPNR
jgi:hypothetical protein